MKHHSYIQLGCGLLAGTLLAVTTSVSGAKLQAVDSAKAQPVINCEFRPVLDGEPLPVILTKGSVAPIEGTDGSKTYTVFAKCDMAGVVVRGSVLLTLPSDQTIQIKVRKYAF